MSKTLFRTTDLHKSFQGLVATDGVSVDVNEHEIHALIGPNGAGKSTLVNLITGYLEPDRGTVELDGQRIERVAPHLRVLAGMSRCFQVSSIFPSLSVIENLRLAVQAQSPAPLRAWGGKRRRDAELNQRATQLAQRVGLEASLEQIAGSLPHGAQRQLDVALALAANPKLLLLDEPMAGMGPDESERMVELISKLRTDMAILLIEHDMEAVFRLADRVTVLVNGQVLASGDTDSIRNDERVRAVYLGTEE